MVPSHPWLLGESQGRGSLVGCCLCPFEGTRGVGELLGFSRRVSGTVSHFRAEQWTSLETQVASRVATGKSGLHGRGKGEHVIALQSG